MGGGGGETDAPNRLFMKGFYTSTFDYLSCVLKIVPIKDIAVSVTSKQCRPA